MLSDKQKIWRATNRDRLSANSKKYYEANRDKILARNKAYAAGRKETIRAYYREYRGIPIALRPEPIHCENCGRLPGRAGRLEIDHDHNTGAFRGWLCHRCNLGLGNLGDTIEAVERTLEYLKRALCQTKSLSPAPEPPSALET